MVNGQGLPGRKVPGLDTISVERRDQRCLFAGLGHVPPLNWLLYSAGNPTGCGLRNGIAHNIITKRGENKKSLDVNLSRPWAPLPGMMP